MPLKGEEMSIFFWSCVAVLTRRETRFRPFQLSTLFLALEPSSPSFWGAPKKSALKKG